MSGPLNNWGNTLDSDTETDGVPNKQTEIPLQTRTGGDTSMSDSPEPPSSPPSPFASQPTKKEKKNEKKKEKTPTKFPNNDTPVLPPSPSSLAEKQMEKEETKEKEKTTKKAILRVTPNDTGLNFFKGFDSTKSKVFLDNATEALQKDVQDELDENGERFIKFIHTCVDDMLGQLVEKIVKEKSTRSNRSLLAAAKEIIGWFIQATEKGDGQMVRNNVLPLITRPYMTQVYAFLGVSTTDDFDFFFKELPKHLPKQTFAQLINNPLLTGSSTPVLTGSSKPLLTNQPAPIGARAEAVNAANKAKALKDEEKNAAKDGKTKVKIGGKHHWLVYHTLDYDKSGHGKFVNLDDHEYKIVWDNDCYAVPDCARGYRGNCGYSTCWFWHRA